MQELSGSSLDRGGGGRTWAKYLSTLETRHGCSQMFLCCYVSALQKQKQSTLAKKKKEQKKRHSLFLECSINKMIIY